MRYTSRHFTYLLYLLAPAPEGRYSYNTNHQYEITPVHYLLPQEQLKVSHTQMVLWPTYPYQLPLSKTTRCGRDFVQYCISKKF